MSLKDVLTRIAKQYGNDAIFRLGDPAVSNVEVIPTGVLSLDLALGVGGLPRGRITEIYGPPGGGKTTIAQQVVVQAQRSGGKCAVVDAEHSLDTKYARALGVDVDNLIVNQPDYGEQGLEIAQDLISSKEIDVLVVDSVAALTPRAEIEGAMGDQLPGLQARMMSQAMRKLTHVVHSSRTVCIFINQTRFKIGVMFGNPETTSGGEALKFAAGVRIDVRRIAAIKDGETVIGAKTRAKIVKNKVAAPFREAEFDLLYGLGAAREADLVDLGVLHGFIEKSGSWYNFTGGDRIAQGRDNVIARLKEDAVSAAELERNIREKFNAR
jgi:recombination protein RecA